MFYRSRESSRTVEIEPKSKITSQLKHLMSYVKRSGWQDASTNDTFKQNQSISKSAESNLRFPLGRNPKLNLESVSWRRRGKHSSTANSSSSTNTISASTITSRSRTSTIQPELPEIITTNSNSLSIPSLLKNDMYNKSYLSIYKKDPAEHRILTNPISSQVVSHSDASSTSSATIQKPTCCDKCDGKHLTENCPYYKKQRENHPDAQKGGKQIGGTSTLPGAYYSNARVVRQPGDGSCLFHSLSYGLRDGSMASSLRSEICAFIERNPEFQISDTPLKDWVRWDSGVSVVDYARRMSRGAWGGGIEMATFSKIKNCNVHVYERYGNGFKRISAFDHPDSPETKKTIRVLYCGGVHYDALVV